MSNRTRTIRLASLATDAYHTAQAEYAVACDRSPCHADAWVSLLVAERCYSASVGRPEGIADNYRKPE